MLAFSCLHESCISEIWTILLTITSSFADGALGRRAPAAVTVDHARGLAH
uniref:Uncharacterized protein n=1 Tax=Arundo donax TaxID=35708 RepID=A0A0A9EB04_ARUDO